MNEECKCQATTSSIIVTGFSCFNIVQIVFGFNCIVMFYILK